MITRRIFLIIILILTLSIVTSERHFLRTLFSPPPVSADSQVLKVGPSNATLTLPGTSAWLPNGNLGIGTTNPANKLEVSGGIDATTLNTGPGDYELYAMNQNVQTSNSPTFAGLTINGSIAVTGNVDGYDISAKGPNWDAAYSHITDTGASHSYINQSVTTTASPTFANVYGTGYLKSGSPTVSYAAAASGDLWAGDSSGSFQYDASTNIAAYYRGSADATGFYQLAYKSRGTPAAPTVITTGDDLFLLRAYGYSGATNGYKEAGRITMDTEGTIADGRVPGRMMFYTAVDAAGSALTERMRIDSAGNVGIGTGTATSRLTVSGSIDTSTQFLGQSSDTAAAPSFSWTSATTDGMYRAGTNIVGFTTAGSEKMRVDAAGNVGFGTTSTTEDVNIFKGNASTIRFYSSYSPPADASNYGYIQQRGTTLLLGTGIHINEAGSNAIDSPSKFQGTFSINDNWTHVFSWSSNNPSIPERKERMFLDYPGDLTVVNLGTGTLYTNAGKLTNTNPSSLDYKTDIQPVDLKADRILKLEPRSFVWKTDGKHDIGYIAEEVRNVVPELWRQDASGTKGYDVAKLPFYIIEVLKEQQKKLNEFADTIRTKQLFVKGTDILKEQQQMKTEIQAQRQEIETLKAQIKVLQSER